tara:strand:+ start:204 stop:902 length:699 start_codon:yes stop_codon:yes gene_type:complete
MSFHYSPRIVTNGLVLCLDANATSSYPGSGTTWYDVAGAGAQNAILYNSVGFDSDGYLTYNGTDQWCSVVSPGSYNTYSFEMFINILGSTQYSSRFFGHSSYGTYTLLNPANVTFHFNPDSATSSASSVSIGSSVNVGYGNWFHVCVTSTRPTTYETKIYINGSLENTSGFVPAGTVGGTFVLGAQRNPTTWPSGGQQPSYCNIGNFHLYDRLLTAAEVKQNFDAQKSRFGL